MPIYMKIDGVRGNVTGHDHKEYSGSANGGVWKTTNFLTRETAGRVALGQTKVKVFICPSDPDVVQISQISMTPGIGGVDGRDPSAKFKVEQLINQARSQGPNGKLYIATDAGVFHNGSRFGGQGKLLVGTDQGVWRSGGVQEAASKMRSANNLKQLSLGAHNSATVEIIVTDASGNVVGSHRLNGASVSGSTGGTFTLTFNGQTTGGY